ncbi:MAG: NAD(P)-binding domain-containing protein, partial [Clostridia bacterium]|nr:NAD(P)-binding domain-containing protein [Clostridia bacterium]
MKKVGVIGAGSWGTALAIHLANKGNDVTLWAFLKEEVEELSKTRKHVNLPEAVIPDSIKITNDVKEAIEGNDIILMVVPSNFMRQNVEMIKPFVKDNQVIVNASKG